LRVVNDGFFFDNIGWGCLRVNKERTGSVKERQKEATPTAATLPKGPQKYNGEKKKNQISLQSCTSITNIILGMFSKVSSDPNCPLHQQW
jgi:hypothetical protein